MPYVKSSRLPGEQASKLGHLEVVQSPFVKSLIEKFEHPDIPKVDHAAHGWQSSEAFAKPLSVIMACDGSLSTVSSGGYPSRELAFVKTALVRMDQDKLDEIDKKMPHPLHMKELMGEALFHATVFPLKNISIPGETARDLVRGVVRDSLKIDLAGEIHETLKWIAYKKWRKAERSPSPNFSCPCCGETADGLAHDADEGACSKCAAKVYIADVIGFHMEMGEDSAPSSLATSYMLIHETLMLFTAVRHFWEAGDFFGLSNLLLVKDGPLALRSQYSKFVDRIRDLFDFSRERNVPIHLVGQEKTGAFVDHLGSLQRSVHPLANGEPPSFFIVSHEYARNEVYRASEQEHPYGEKTNYGEKIFVKLDSHTAIVITVPTGSYINALASPSKESDFVGLGRILATLPSLVSPRFEGALVPISLANGVASLSSYPSAEVLKMFGKL